MLEQFPYNFERDNDFTTMCATDAWTHALYTGMVPHMESYYIVPGHHPLNKQGCDRILTLHDGRTLSIEEKWDRNLPVNFALEFEAHGKPGVFEKENQATDIFFYCFWHEVPELREWFMWSWQRLKGYWDAHAEEFMRLGNLDTHRNTTTSFKCYFMPITTLIRECAPFRMYRPDPGAREQHRNAYYARALKTFLPQSNG
jgi:hypothetical protein